MGAVSAATAPPLEPHALDASDVARRLAVSPDHGLAPAERRGRLLRHGPNALRATAPPSIWRSLVHAAGEPFVLLLAAAGMGAVMLGESRDGLLVLAGLVPIVGADVATSYRSERALAELRAAVAPRAEVLVNGARVIVPAAELVPGDVISLVAGYVVPADARVLAGGSLLLNRAVLTGESAPEEASALPDRADAPLAERRSIVYAGTSVVAGRGSAVVVATGGSTALGLIAESLGAGSRRRSPLQRELDRLVRILLVAAIALIIVTVGLGFLRGHPAGANLLAGISAAIAAIPEEPPVLLAVVLGLGAYQLMRRGVLVRRLAAQETLGAVDLIITDKTGTLTENRLVVEAVLAPTVPMTSQQEVAALLDALAAEEDAWDAATASRLGSFTASITAALRERSLPTDLDRRRLVSVAPPRDGRPFAIARLRDGERWREVALGAPEAISRFETASSTRTRGAWDALIETEAARGGRLLLLATREGEVPWTLSALLRFGDPVRADVPDAVGLATRAGIQVMMVTGDHLATAGAVADAVGLPAGDRTTGHSLDGSSDAEVTASLRGLRVVARAVPDHKLRLVRLAQAAGRSVAVTGDGVNDAPALQAADVAVAMGSGSAVAREACDLVLGDDSFTTMMRGLREGRRIVANVQKGLVFLVSTHVALLGFILVATVAGFAQPLLPLQILWLELFIDLSTSVAFEREPEEPGAMDRPPPPRGRPLLTSGILVRIAGAGGFSALAAFGVLLAHPGPFEHSRWAAYTTLVVAQAVRAYANRSLAHPVHRLRPNGFLALACTAAIAIQAVIPFVPFLADAFRAVPLAAGEWAVVAAIAMAPAVVAEAVRRSGRSGAWIA